MYGDTCGPLADMSDVLERALPADETRIGLRLTRSELEMLRYLAKERYPEMERAHSMLIRRLIREEYHRELMGA